MRVLKPRLRCCAVLKRWVWRSSFPDAPPPRCASYDPYAPLNEAPGAGAGAAENVYEKSKGLLEAARLTGGVEVDTTRGQWKGSGRLKGFHAPGRGLPDELPAGGPPAAPAAAPADECALCADERVSLRDAHTVPLSCSDDSDSDLSSSSESEVRVRHLIPQLCLDTVRLTRRPAPDRTSRVLRGGAGRRGRRRRRRSGGARRRRSANGAEATTAAAPAAKRRAGTSISTSTSTASTRRARRSARSRPARRRREGHDLRILQAPHACGTRCPFLTAQSTGSCMLVLAAVQRA